MIVGIESVVRRSRYAVCKVLGYGRTSVVCHIVLRTVANGINCRQCFKVLCLGSRYIVYVLGTFRAGAIDIILYTADGNISREKIPTWVPFKVICRGTVSK